MKRIILFIILSLALTLLLTVQNISEKKKTIAPKAADAQCPQPSGNEPYENSILPVGSHLAANNNPGNYLQIRQLYNCQNKNNLEVQKRYIPVVIDYDLFFLKGSIQGIQINLNELKRYGLFPIIRVASYMNGKNQWIKLFPPTDAVIMAQNLSKALEHVQGFPDKPIVVFSNESNLHDEWEGQTNPEEFAESFQAFTEAMGQGNFRLYFPAMSYGANAQNGISPQDFLARFFASNKFTTKLDGADLNIYGTDYNDISTQLTAQKGAFEPYISTFKTPMGISIGELGPVRNGTAIYDCDPNGEWSNVASGIVREYVKNQSVIATMACFGNTTDPIIAHYDDTDSPLIKLQTYGQIQNTGNNQNTNKPQIIQQTNTNTQKNNDTTNAKGSFAFTIENTNLNIDFVSDKPLAWVNLAGIGPSGKITMAGITPLMKKDTKGYHWIYHIKEIKNGTYSFTFSSSCNKYNQKGQTLKDICDVNGTGSITVNNKIVVQETPDIKQYNVKPNSSYNDKIKEILSKGEIQLDLSKGGLNVWKPETIEYCYSIETQQRDCINPGIKGNGKRVVKGDIATITFPPNKTVKGFCADIKPEFKHQMNAQIMCISLYEN